MGDKEIRVTATIEIGRIHTHSSLRLSHPIQAVEVAEIQSRRLLTVDEDRRKGIPLLRFPRQKVLPGRNRSPQGQVLLRL